MNIKKLSERAKHVAAKIANRVQSFYTGRGTQPSYGDYPSTVVACKSDLKKKIYDDTSRGIPHVIAPLLKTALMSLGPIGGKRPGCKNVIGHCAEPHAANNLLKDQRGILSLDQIYFGYAYRPRTGQVVPTCDNCRQTFNNTL